MLKHWCREQDWPKSQATCAYQVTLDNGRLAGVERDRATWIRASSTKVCLCRRTGCPLRAPRCTGCVPRARSARTRLAPRPPSPPPPPPPPPPPFQPPPGHGGSDSESEEEDHARLDADLTDAQRAARLKMASVARGALSKAEALSRQGRRADASAEFRKAARLGNVQAMVSSEASAAPIHNSRLFHSHPIALAPYVRVLLQRQARRDG